MNKHTMLSHDTMWKLANQAIENAPNEDWQNRGGVTLCGDLRQVPVQHWDGKKIGDATIAYFKFEKPLKDSFETGGISPFVGFTLAAMEVLKKGKGKCTIQTVYETRPIIHTIRDENYTANGLSHRFCPQCLSLDSVKSSSRLVGPECALITYKCKCGYRDEDVMD